MNEDLCMMNGGRGGPPISGPLSHHHHQPHQTPTSNLKIQQQQQQQPAGCQCCFSYNQQFDHHRNSQHNLSYYQPTASYSVCHNNWYNNNTEYIYENYENQSQTATTTTSWQNNKNTSPMWSSSNEYNDYNYSYPTPPTPAGSTISAASGSSGEYPPSVAPSIPSDHYPPTPYSVDLNSPPTTSNDLHSPVTQSDLNSPNGHDYYNVQAQLEDDIPLHELSYWAAEAVQADLLESLEKAQNKAKNMTSAINIESLQVATKVAEMAVEAADDAAITVEREISGVPTPQPEAVPATTSTVNSTGKIELAAESAEDKTDQAALLENGLSRVLQETCEDFEVARRLGYPLNRLWQRRKRTRSPSPPCLESCPGEAHLNSHPNADPPMLECEMQDQPKVKTIRLTFDRLQQKRQQEEKEKKLTTFNFVCSSCPKSWPLSDSASISEHFAQTGLAPLIKPHRLQFSSLFQYYSYKVKLLVNPKNHTVSSKTFISCNECDKAFDIKDDLALYLNDHLGTHLKLNKNFCYICDRKVPDLHRHLDEYFSIHQDKLVSMAPCIHPDEALLSSTQVENECKKCGEQYVPDPRLPDWMSRATCQTCLEKCSRFQNQKSEKGKVILCTYCRQGKFGMTKKLDASGKLEISICVQCTKMAQAFYKMTDALQCTSYVTGMLNELVKQLNAKKQEKISTPPPKKASNQATFSLRQHLKSNLSTNLSGKLKKFQAFSLQDMKTIEAVSNAIHTENEAHGTFQCSQCPQSWPLNSGSSSNWLEIVRHLVHKSGSFAKHLSPLVDQYLVILSTDQKVFSWTSVLKCRKCKFYLNGDDLTSHACFKSARGACALCNTRHTGSGPSDKCVSLLTGALALHCKNSSKCDDKKAVIKNNNNNHHTLKKETLLKVANCFATITNAFNEDANDSIEELIVASKQQIL